MRGTRLVFIIVGWLLLIAGFVLIGLAQANNDDNLELATTLGGVGVGLAITGLVFLFVARYLKNLLGATALDEPVPGTAQVLSVADTGVTINNLNAVFRVQATITVDGLAPYEGQFKIVVGRAQYGAVQPGMTLPVFVERSDPSKIVHDRDRPAVAQGTGGGAPAIARTMTAADVIARGVATQGVLHGAELVGMTAGQVMGNLPAHEADDPIVKVVLVYTPSGMAEQRNEFLVRVPDGKGHWLRPGETLPVAYLPDEPTTATIDWSRL